MLPSSAVQNVAHRDGMDIQDAAKLTGRQVRPKHTNQSHSGLIKTSAAHAFSARLSAMQRCVMRVLSWRCPAKIAQLVIQPIAVAVASIHALWPWPNKRGENRVMYQHCAASSHEVLVAVPSHIGFDAFAFVGAPDKPARSALNAQASLRGANLPAAINLIPVMVWNVAPVVSDNEFSHEALQMLIGQRPAAICTRLRALSFEHIQR